MPKRSSALRLNLAQDAPSGLEPETIAGPPTQWVHVSVPLARQWLAEVNTNNRTVRESHVIRLASDMKAGKWLGFNGEAICFDSKGRLINGQHRLLACVQSNQPFKTLLVTGLDPEVYSTIDIGAKKSLGDFLGPVNGERNVLLLAAGIRLVAMWRKGTLGKPKDGTVLPTVAELQRVFQENPGIRDSTAFIQNNKEARKLLTSSYGVLIHYAGTVQNRKPAAEMFLNRLGDGLGLEQDDPVYQLRKFLLTQRGATPGHRRAGQLYVLALTIKAWNATKESKKLGHLRLANNEEFPIL